MRQVQAIGFKNIFRQFDKPSVRQMIDNHIAMLNKSECKYMKTTDQETLSIAQDILKGKEFLSKYILGAPGSSTSQVGSLKVKICDIRKHQPYLEKYNQWRNQGKGRIVAIGGPSATDQTLLSTMIPSIRDNYDVHYYCRDYLESNVLHSASQSHARHGNALNADPVLRGLYLLPVVLRRMLFKPTLDQVLEPDYIKVDVKFNNLKYLREYLKNEINGTIQDFKWKMGMMNEHDVNRLESVCSQQIQKVMQKALDVSFRSTKNIAEKDKSMAIHLIFNEASRQQVLNEQSTFKNVKQLRWNQLTQEEIKKYFPHSTGVMTAFRYHDDFHNRFDMFDVEKVKAIKAGAKWQQNKTLSEVFINQNQNGSPQVCGIKFTDGEFVPADKVHLTLGYKGQFQFQDSSIKPLTSMNLPATGLSMNILLKKTDQIKEIMKQKGNCMEIAIINSHWTIIDHNDKYLLVRATAGGNTGSEAYMPHYFLNLIVNTRRIFGDAFVGVVSSYGCSRAVNYKNSTQFAHLADGLVISYGKGGTGNTKRASQAFKALKYLGLQKQVSDYVSSFEKDRLDIVESMNLVCQQSAKSNLYYKNYAASSKFLRGFVQSPLNKRDKQIA